jgi:nicotinate-nucleotide adenylyltransferase
MKHMVNHSHNNPPLDQADQIAYKTKSSSCDSALTKTILLFGGTFNPPHFAHLLMIYILANHSPQTQANYLPNITDVEFILSMPWQKKNVLAAMHRHKMLCLSLQAWQKIDSRIKINLEEVENYQQRNILSYSILTLINRHQHYQRIYDSQQSQAIAQNSFKLIYIIGQDQYHNLHTWHRWQEIFSYTDIWVVSRQGSASHINSNITAEQHAHILFINADELYQQLKVNDAWLKIENLGTFNQSVNRLQSISSSRIRDFFVNHSNSNTSINSEETLMIGHNHTNIKDMLPTAVCDYILDNHLYDPTTYDNKQ